MDDTDRIRLKENIETTAKQVAFFTKQLAVLRSLCNPHRFVPVGKQKDRCVCDTCGMNGGWYCRESPDGRCWYNQHDGTGYMDTDECFYCGQPLERA